MKRLLGIALLNFCLLTLLPVTALADYRAELTQDQAWEKISAKSITVIDTRSAAEFGTGHVPGAINIPHDQIASSLAEIPVAKDQPILLYCRTGRRAALAEATLTSLGYSNLYHLQGDMAGWADTSRPTSK